MGITPDGKKEIIDFVLATSENNVNWERFLSRPYSKRSWWSIA
jgi:transposase-like protein